MSLINRTQVEQFLTELKIGSVLTSRKHNGDKNSRHYFLQEHEHFISYRQLDKTLTKSPRCK